KQSLPAVEIRLLRQLHEFESYFKLRHRVYAPMSYLDSEIEKAPSKMEIDWFDKKSIHIGAFAQTGYGGEKLVGATRLITTKLINSFHSGMAERMSERDQVLRQKVRNGAVVWLLPVFQSHGEMITEVHEAALRGVVFGELSKVIVHPDFRGGRLSQRL